ncbi:MAG: AAA family ATPase [Oscillibacter sp.]|nr:AAA family ATPase [Oscillibacter sp.]
MIIKKIKLENYTVFEDQQIEFCPGINIFIGENGTGKTHILKALYSACQSVSKKTSFSHKLVSTMLPDDYKISRLITRKQGNRSSLIRITAGEREASQDRILTASFHGKTKKWDAEVSGEDGWEESFAGMSSIFIPAKEILSHGYNLNAAAEMDNVRFDDTYLDIINAAKVDISVGRNSSTKESMLKAVEKMTHGTVVYDAERDEFYLKSGRSKQEFNLIAEGIRKMALLWQLIKNGTLENGSVLFWDEPEANINPTYIPIIVEILLELQRKGVQIFISTHDYMIANYFEVKKTETDSILFHSLSHAADAGEVQYGKASRFADLKENAIISAFNKLLDEIYDL